jgi:curved DNA-binding protein CbpA
MRRGGQCGWHEPSQEADVVDPRPSPGPDLYEVLGVAPTADAGEIARAYRRRVREVHPDTADPSQDGGPDELAAIQEAYLVLRDPVRRARYDQQRAATRRAGSGGVPVPVRVRVRRARPQPPPLWAGPVRIDPLN